jgi:VWFA-related protein
LKLPQSPTRDGNALLTYLEQNEPALRSVTRSQGFYGAEDRTSLSLRALGRLAEYEEPRPGRKIVIWVSPGWPLISGVYVQLSNKQQQGLFQSIVDMSTQLRLARVALYSLDPLGTNDSGGFRTFYYEQFLKGRTSAKQVQIGDLALQVISRQSGGRVLNSNNDVAGEIQRSVADGNTYYVLIFEAPQADGPDDYHAIEVKLSPPVLKAQTRMGYYIQP